MQSVLQTRYNFKDSEKWLIHAQNSTFYPNNLIDPYIYISLNIRYWIALLCNPALRIISLDSNNPLNENLGLAILEVCETSLFFLTNVIFH